MCILHDYWRCIIRFGICTKATEVARGKLKNVKPCDDCTHASNRYDMQEYSKQLGARTSFIMFRYLIRLTSVVAWVQSGGHDFGTWNHAMCSFIPTRALLIKSRLIMKILKTPQIMQSKRNICSNKRNKERLKYLDRKRAGIRNNYLILVDPSR